MQRFTKKNTFALTDLINRTSEDTELLNNILASFSCEQDGDIRNFLLNRAVLFENLAKSRTYLIVDENQMNLPGFKLADLTIYGYISLSVKVFKAPETMSNRQRLLLDGFSAKEHGEPIDHFPCYLIGQLARNSNVIKDEISGTELLGFAFDLIGEAVDLVGGRNILVECHNTKKLVQFYLDNGFNKISQIPDEDCEMVQLMRKI